MSEKVYVYVVIKMRISNIFKNFYFLLNLKFDRFIVDVYIIIDFYIFE